MILGRSLFCSHALRFGLSSCHSTHSLHRLKQYFIMVPSPRDLLTAQFCVSGRKAVSSLSALALQFPLYMLLKFLCWGVQLSQRQVNRLWHIYYWSDSVLLMRTHSFTEMIKSVFLLLAFYRKTFSNSNSQLYIYFYRQAWWLKKTSIRKSVSRCGTKTGSGIVLPGPLFLYNIDVKIQLTWKGKESWEGESKQNRTKLRFAAEGLACIWRWC